MRLHWSARRILSFLAVISGLTAGYFLSSNIEAGTCTNQTPLGALPPALPIWCQSLGSGTDTHTAGANSWYDDFNHGQRFASLNPAYREGFIGGGEALHFQHNDHWMVDIQAHTGQYPTMVAAWMRPDRTFKPDANGKVVVEFEVAVPIAGTRSVSALADSWPEIVLSTAPEPTKSNPWGSPWRPSGTYLYEAFPYDWTFGCRIQQSRHPICALYRPSSPGSPNYAGGPDRLWEINQNGGDVTYQYGGDPSFPGLETVWKTCASLDDPDIICRNKFRLELTHNRLVLYVNGVRYYEAGLIDSNLANILNHPAGFYVFLGDFAYQITDGTVVRFHWDHFAINPAAVEPSQIAPSPTPTATSTPPPSTPTATPTATPTPPPPPPASGLLITFDDAPGQNTALNGQYPNGVINWGSNRWYLSGPWSVHTSKSVSFNGPSATRQSFDFLTPMVLVSFKAGGTGQATIRVSCSGNPDKVQTIPANQLVTIETGFTRACTRVTITSSNGWNTNFDDFLVR